MRTWHSLGLKVSPHQQNIQRVPTYRRSHVMYPCGNLPHCSCRAAQDNLPRPENRNQKKNTNMYKYRILLHKLQKQVSSISSHETWSAHRHRHRLGHSVDPWTNGHLWDLHSLSPYSIPVLPLLPPAQCALYILHFLLTGKMPL